MPQATAKPSCPYCGSDKTEVSEMYSVALGGVRSVLECSVCGCTQPLPRHAAKAGAKKPVDANKAVAADLLRIADDMEIRTELDESIGRATVRRWARSIRAAAENAG